jgi:hypothetical protein
VGNPLNLQFNSINGPILPLPTLSIPGAQSAGPPQLDAHGNPVVARPLGKNGGLLTLQGAINGLKAIAKAKENEKEERKERKRVREEKKEERDEEKREEAEEKRKKRRLKRRETRRKRWQKKEDGLVKKLMKAEVRKWKLEKSPLRKPVRLRETIEEVQAERVAALRDLSHAIVAAEREVKEYQELIMQELVENGNDDVSSEEEKNDDGEGDEEGPAEADGNGGGQGREEKNSRNHVDEHEDAGVAPIARDDDDQEWLPAIDGESSP